MKAYTKKEIQSLPHVFFRGETVAWVKDSDEVLCCSWNSGMKVYTRCFEIASEDFERELKNFETLDPGENRA